MTVKNITLNGISMENATIDDIRNILIKDKGFKKIFIKEGNFSEKNSNTSLFCIINELTNYKEKKEYER